MTEAVFGYLGESSDALESAGATSAYGIYVHIPYCASKCPYCDFNSEPIVSRAAGDQQAVLARLQHDYEFALGREISFWAESPLWSGRSCDSIYVGGGTPSIFPAEAISGIFVSLRKAFRFSAEPEISIEGNPSTLSGRNGAEKLSSYRDCGINRISLGVQSFDDSKLAFLGRTHRAEDSRSAIRNIRKAGFPNFNLDLIFGLAGETKCSWKGDLLEAVKSEPEHISVYCLTIGEKSRFFDLQSSGERLTADEDTQAELYLVAEDELERAGFVHYEISNYALSGFECVHNTSCWKRHDYLGIGAGAHSFVANGRVETPILEVPVSQLGPSEGSWGIRWSNLESPAAYTEALRGGADFIAERELLSKEQGELEFIFLGLRTAGGVSTSLYAELFSEDLGKRYEKEIEELLRMGLVEFSDRGLKLTKSGFLLSDSVFSAFTGG